MTSVYEADRNNGNSPHACQTSGFSAHMPCKWHFLKGFPFGQWYLESSSLVRPLWSSHLNMQGQVMLCPSADMQWERDIPVWAALLKPNILELCISRKCSGVSNSDPASLSQLRTFFDWIIPKKKKRVGLFSIPFHFLMSVTTLQKN